MRQRGIPCHIARAEWTGLILFSHRARGHFSSAASEQSWEQLLEHGQFL
jgi:hypothetical protein